MSVVQPLLDAYDTYGAELQFVENAAGTVVHVVREPNLLDWMRHDEPVQPVTDQDLVDLTLGAVVTVCGVRVLRNRGGQDAGGRMVDSFRDELLCARCHRAFGGRAALIFLCNPAA